MGNPVQVVTVLSFVLVIASYVDVVAGGDWSAWGSWSSCDHDCNSYRTRTCDGGGSCAGEDTEPYECGADECPVDGEWAAWNEINCDSTCKGYKKRTCTDPPPLRGGADCTGISECTNCDCIKHDCIRNGGWTGWSDWSSCSVSCDWGQQTRSRECKNPSPRNGGDECPIDDDFFQTTQCYLQNCPQDLLAIAPPLKHSPPPDYAFILSTVFGTLGALTIILVGILLLRKRYLKRKANKAVQAREKTALYQEAMEVSVIPEGKKAQAEKKYKEELKARLKTKMTGDAEKDEWIQELEDLLEEDGDDFAFDSDSNRPSTSSGKRGALDSRILEKINMDEIDQQLKDMIYQRGAGHKKKGPGTEGKNAGKGKEEDMSKVLQQMQLPEYFDEIRNNFWEIPKENIILSNTVAQGTYGQVWRAKGYDISGKTGETICAVKLLKENPSRLEKNAFLKEMELMKTIENHPNVISFLGCVTLREPLYMVLEYAPNGDLLTMLRESRPGSRKLVESIDLVSYAYQVCRGMSFLSNNKVIHRDLSARNILLGERMKCKISNIGRVRNVVENVTEGRLGLRWMSPETTRACAYTTKSDVWSYGILIWEIATFGSTPYPGMATRDVTKRLEVGYRMERPSHCREELYSVMQKCWQEIPDQRPTFQKLLKEMEHLAIGKKEYIRVREFVASKYMDMEESTPSTPGSTKKRSVYK